MGYEVITDKFRDELLSWLRYNFPDENRVTSTLGLAEEAGEVCRAVLKQDQKLRGTYEEWDKEIKKELADVYVKIEQLADLCGWDLHELILDRWDELKKRDWIANPTGHGISYYDYENEGLGGT
jgi:NTP pyrophosphatase (non-canonical NTP hydrolase)